MENEISIGFQNSELDKELTFEVSKEQKITTKVTFKKGDVIDQLICRIRNLENEVKRLNKNDIIISEDALTKLWNNENDKRWDSI